VFIVGVPRSGTTVLYRTLVLHPSFTSPRLNLAESHAVDNLHAFIDGHAVPARQLKTFLLGDDVPPHVRQLIARLRRRRMVVRRIAGPRHEWDPRVWRLGGEHLVVRAYLRAAAHVRGAARLVEKTPRHLARVEHLCLAFPDARFVSIHRHPVDVLASHWRRFAFDGEAAAWANVGVRQFADQWATGVAVAEAHAARLPKAFLVVRYEDLVSRTEPVVRAVLDHVGEAFDPACLASFDRPAADVRDPRSHLPMSARADDWREFVDPADAASLEQRLLRPMERLSYAPYTSDAW
jgi:hypothetical protein